MPYSNRIKTLEESIRLLSDQIFQMGRELNSDADKIAKLEQKKLLYSTELRTMIIRASELAKTGESGSTTSKSSV